ncbi:relaxase/mobilization nuclease domain-containing protein, partial [Bacteroides fragilis]|uniref:relaxase/mobilization nuclease domain-containing protein n=1 Tax=Bacteroides fragilis TaxID=817 RepID=UPI0005CF7E4B
MPLVNSHIVEECLPFTSLRLDPEDINLSMGTGYVPDAEIQAISDALETTEKNSRQAHLHILANRVSLSGELYKDNWIGKRATEAANSIARERNLVQSKDIGKANREEIKQAMDSVLT